MAKFYGRIGFSETYEDEPGVWRERIVPKEYLGDIVREGRRWENGTDTINDDFIVNNYVSIVADSFAMKNYQNMKWVEILEAKWKIRSAEIEYPRIKLTLGGVWNGE